MFEPKPYKGPAAPAHAWPEPKPHDGPAAPAHVWPLLGDD